MVVVLGSFFLACDDLGEGSTNHSPFALYYHYFFFKVGISSRISVPLFRSESQQPSKLRRQHRRQIYISIAMGHLSVFVHLTAKTLLKTVWLTRKRALNPHCERRRFDAAFLLLSVYKVNIQNKDRFCAAIPHLPPPCNTRGCLAMNHFPLWLQKFHCARLTVFYFLCMFSCCFHLLLVGFFFFFFFFLDSVFFQSFFPL